MLNLVLNNRLLIVLKLVFLVQQVFCQQECFTESAGIFGCGEGCTQNTQYSWTTGLPSGDFIVAGDTLSKALFPTIGTYSYYFMTKVNSQFVPYYAVSVGGASNPNQLESNLYQQFFSLSSDSLYFFLVVQQTGIQGVKVADGSFLQYYTVPYTMVYKVNAVSLNSVFILGRYQTNPATGDYVAKFDLTSANPTAFIYLYSYMPLYQTTYPSIARYVMSFTYGNYYYVSGFQDQSGVARTFNPFIARYDTTQNMITSGI